MFEEIFVVTGRVGGEPKDTVLAFRLEKDAMEYMKKEYEKVLLDLDCTPDEEDEEEVYLNEDEALIRIDSIDWWDWHINKCILA